MTLEPKSSLFQWTPRTILILFALAVVVTAGLYGYDVPNYPVLDDVPNLDILDMLHQGGEGGVWQLIWGNHSGMSPRAIPMFSFVVDALRAPGDMAAMRVTNIILHLGIGLVLFGWLNTLLRVLAYPRTVAASVGAVVAGLWLLAPIQISTVYYPVQRMAMWPVFFILLALWHYTWLRSNLLDTRPRAAWVHLLVIYLIWLPLAWLSKETGVLLPLFLALLECGLLSHLASPLGLWLRRGHRLVVGVFVAGAVYVVAEGSMIAYGGPGSMRDFTVTDRIASQAFILWDYARQILFPDIARMGLYHDDVPVRALWEWQSAAMLWLTIGAFAASLLMLRAHSRRLRLMGFGMAFFFVGHLLESTIFNLELYFEHRNYLPSIGLILAVVMGIFALLRLLPHPRRWFVLVLAVYLGLTVYYTASEIYIWRFQPRHIEKVWRNHPGSQRTNLLAAEMFAAMDHPELALEVVMTAPDRMVRLASREESEKLVALKKIYFSLAAGIVPDPSTYTQIGLPWPGSSLFERPVTANSIRELPADKLALLDWPAFARTTDAILEVPSRLKSRAYAAFVLHSAYLAIHFKDLERAQRYFSAVHDQMRIYVPWTAVPLFRFAVDAGDLEAARRYLHDFEQESRWEALYPIQIENMHDELRRLEAAASVPAAVEPSPRDAADPDSAPISQENRTAADAAFAEPLTTETPTIPQEADDVR